MEMIDDFWGVGDLVVWVLVCCIVFERFLWVFVCSVGEWGGYFIGGSGVEIERSGGRCGGSL